MEQAGIEVLKEEWQGRSWSKLPEGAGLRWEELGSGSGEEAEQESSACACTPGGRALLS
jgi:hypothetical protein